MVGLRVPLHSSHIPRARPQWPRGLRNLCDAFHPPKLFLALGNAGPSRRVHACLPELVTQTRATSTLSWPEIALNHAMACYHCLMPGLIGGSFRSREVFHGWSHSFDTQRISAQPRTVEHHFQAAHTCSDSP